MSELRVFASPLTKKKYRFIQVDKAQGIDNYSGRRYPSSLRKDRYLIPPEIVRPNKEIRLTSFSQCPYHGVLIIRYNMTIWQWAMSIPSDTCWVPEKYKFCAGRHDRSGIDFLCLSANLHSVQCLSIARRMSSDQVLGVVLLTRHGDRQGKSTVSSRSFVLNSFIRLLSRSYNLHSPRYCDYPHWYCEEPVVSFTSPSC